MDTLQDTIIATLRERIVRGKLKPGERFPDRRTLARTFDVSPVTVQGVMARLAAEGFVTVGARKFGTFVADRPPHLHRYKLVFPFDPEARGGFWRVLRAVAGKMAAETTNDFSFFYGLGGHRDIASYQEVVEDVRTERVAGLIFASSAKEFLGTPVLDQPGLPRTAFASDYELPGIPKLNVDYDRFFSRALDFLVSRGRSRIAVLFGASEWDASPASHHLACAKHMKQRGLAQNPLWTQYAHLWSPLAARQCLRLMFHPGQTQRPDGLIIADDSLMLSATRGLADAAIDIPGQLDVVGMTNFPGISETAVPITRLGFAVDAMLREFVATIEQLRVGGKPPDYREYPALFEHEWRAGMVSRPHAIKTKGKR